VVKVERLEQDEQKETKYVNQYLSDTNGTLSKHIFAGAERIASVFDAGEQTFTYYYHTDHLGSTGYMTDADGVLVEHIEYTPWGETWHQPESGVEAGMPSYRFTSKELDLSGMYYFGARYYDPQTSMWMSPDPILEKYLPGQGGDDEGLLGRGGVFNSKNLSLFAYTHQNPVRFLDPDGKELKEYTLAGKKTYLDDKFSPRIEKWIEAAKEKGVTIQFHDDFRAPGVQKDVKTSKIKAKPGSSLHEAGMAVDISERLAARGVDITDIILFGSRARGNAGKDSDIDLIIVSESFRRKDIFERAAMIGPAEAEAIKKFRIPFDIITKTPEEYDSKKSLIVSCAMEEGISVNG